MNKKNCHLKNYVTYGFLDVPLWVFFAFKLLEYQITEVCETLDVLLDNMYL